MLASRQAQCLCAAALLCLGAVVVLPVASMLPSAAQQSPAPAAAPVPFAPASTPEQERLRILAAKGYPGTVHVLPATSDTTQWGWFNNAQPPVLHVKSGDTIPVRDDDAFAQPDPARHYDRQDQEAADRSSASRAPYFDNASV